MESIPDGKLVLPNLMKTPDGMFLPPAEDPTFFKHDCVEKLYAKPKGYIALHRSYFPKKLNNIAEQTAFAAKNTKGYDEKLVTEQVEMQMQMHKIIRDHVTSKVIVELLKEADRLEISYQGKPATTTTEIRKGWYEELSLERCKQMYDLVYGPREDGETVNRLHYAICRELRIWLTADDPDNDYTTKGVSKNLFAKTTIVREKIRDAFRHKKRNLMEKAPHGVSIVISKTGPRKRRKKGFDLALVTGWHEQKHKDWMIEQQKKTNLSQQNDMQISHPQCLNQNASVLKYDYAASMHIQV
jgi:hypothetical protein